MVKKRNRVLDNRTKQNYIYICKGISYEAGNKNHQYFTSAASYKISLQAYRDYPIRVL